MQRSEDGPPSKARLHKVAAGRVCDCSAGIGTVFPSKVFNPVSSLGLRGSHSTPTSIGAGVVVFGGPRNCEMRMYDMPQMCGQGMSCVEEEPPNSWRAVGPGRPFLATERPTGSV